MTIIPGLILAAEDTPAGELSIYRVGSALGVYTRCCLFMPTTIHHNDPVVWSCNSCKKVLKTQPTPLYSPVRSLSLMVPVRMVKDWVGVWTGIMEDAMVVEVRWD